MFENFNVIDFIILGASVFMNVVLLICMVILLLKDKNKKSVLQKTDEVKVTKVNETVEPTAFEEIIEAMQKDIESEQDNAVELFEQEQEEKAIISYQELLDAKHKSEPTYTKVDVSKEIPLVEESVEQIHEKTNATPVLATAPQTKFTNSEFVSPVFGKMDRTVKNNVQIQVEANEDYENHDLEKTLNIEPLTEEIKKNNEFLNALKEFRKNL